MLVSKTPPRADIVEFAIFVIFICAMSAAGKTPKVGRRQPQSGPAASDRPPPVSGPWFADNSKHTQRSSSVARGPEEAGAVDGDKPDEDKTTAGLEKLQARRGGTKGGQ